MAVLIPSMKKWSIRLDTQWYKNGMGIIFYYLLIVRTGIYWHTMEKWMISSWDFYWNSSIANKNPRINYVTDVKLRIKLLFIIRMRGSGLCCQYCSAKSWSGNLFWLQLWQIVCCHSSDKLADRSFSVVTSVIRICYLHTTPSKQLGRVAILGQYKVSLKEEIFLALWLELIRLRRCV